MSRESPILAVCWNGNKVGQIWRDGDDGIDFAYDADWVRNGKPAISLTLPTKGKWAAHSARRWFANLLPEADVRIRIEQRLKIAPGDDFGLLAAIGGDCAGALSIGSESLDGEWRPAYAPLSDVELTELIRSEGLVTSEVGGWENRLSLAGAQGKVPVYILDGEVSLPKQGSPSTHIIKFNRLNGDFPRLIENEFYMMSIARHVGLNVPECSIQRHQGKSFYVIKRYDRMLNSRGVQRLHQEDFCQALGIGHLRKYQKDGGPGVKSALALARQYLGVLAVNQLLDWYLFNLLLGNSDGHAKNISIMHEPDLKLAPFYDLVCTRAYDSIDFRVAMDFGGETDPNKIGADHLHAFLEDSAVTKPFLRRKFHDLAERIPLAVTAAKSDVQKAGIAENDMQFIYQKQAKVFKSVVTRLKVLLQ